MAYTLIRMRVPINKSIKFHNNVDEKKDPIKIIMRVIVFKIMIHILFDFLKYSRQDSL